MPLHDAGLSSEARKLLFSYRKMFNELSERNRGNNAMEMARADNKKTVTRMNEENMQVTGESLALPVGDEIVDAKTVTEEDVRTLLGNAYKKKYKDGSYIPVRVNTPAILIESAKNIGKTIEDFPVIIQVKKARQMMYSQREWVLDGQTGSAHEFSTNDVIALIRAMNKPKQIVYQSADERYVEIVEFETEEKQKAVAVLEIGGKT